MSGNHRTWPGADETSAGGRGMRLPNDWRAEEGTSSPTASRYFLRSSRAPICAGDTRAGPGMRPATSSIMVAAKKTRSRLASSDEVERQKADEAPITKSPERAEKKRGKRQQNQKYLAPRMKRGEVNTHTHNTHTTHTHTHTQTYLCTYAHVRPHTRTH